MSILTEDENLRFGYTTGACAAAGVKAILLKEKGQPYEKVQLTALDGTELLIPIKEVVVGEDDPDITNGTSVFVELRSLPEGGETVFKAGEGVGTITKPGLSLPVGEPSINPGPRKLIRQVLQEMMGSFLGWEVTISIPAGVALSGKTIEIPITTGQHTVEFHMEYGTYTCSYKQKLKVLQSECSMTFQVPRGGQTIAIVESEALEFLA